MNNFKVNRSLGILLLILVNLIYGANYTIAKAIMPSYIQPFGFIFIRVSVALLLYLLIYFFFIREKVSYKDIPTLFFCGLFGVAINQLFFFKGLSMTSTAHASLLMILTPIITLILSAIFLKERLTTFKILGIILGAIGASFLILVSTNTNREASVIGDIFILLNATSFSIYLIISKPLLKKYNPITVITYTFIFGFIWVTLAGYSEYSQIDWVHFPEKYYINILFVTVAATFLVYLFNISAMQSLSATTVSSFMYLQPFFAILISVFYTQERLTLDSIIGGLFIIFGLWLINYKTKKPEII